MVLSTGEPSVPVITVLRLQGSVKDDIFKEARKEIGSDIVPIGVGKNFYLAESS